MKNTIFTACVLLASALSTTAAPINWVLQDVVFQDGGLATGGFTFDAETNSYSDINIIRTAGLAPGGANALAHEAATFTQVSPASSVTPGASFTIFTTDAADQSGALFFQLFFDTALSDAGAVTGLNAIGTGTGRCASATCNSVQAGQAVLISAGSVAPAPVPLPASAAFLALGLAGLAGLRRLKA